MRIVNGPDGPEPRWFSEPSPYQVDPFAEFQRQCEREDRERKARQEAEEKARKAKALSDAVRQAEKGSIAAMQQVLELIATDHNIKIVWREPDSEAYGFASGRTVHIPPIRSEVEFAVGLHEIGHCLSEPCRGGDHQRHRDGRWTNCMRCELNADEKALTLAPFSRAMFQEMRRGLQSYRQSTPAPATAVQALDQMASGVAYIKAKQMQYRRDLIAQWKREGL
jgi:hypothetical protein